MGIVARVTGVVLGPGLVIGLVMGMAHPAAAQDDGLDETATTTWDVRPRAGEAQLTVDLSLRNTIPDTDDGRTYFDSYGIALPLPPGDVSVSIDGDEVDAEVTTLEDGTPGIQWDFPDRLFHDQRQDWQVEVTFPSAAPRSDFGDGPRVTPAFVMVPIWAWGPDGGDLEVRIPASMGPQLGLAEPTSVGDGVAVFRRDDATDFSEFLVGASDDGERTSETVDVAGTAVTVESWPDDPDWGERMAGFAAQALPELAAWTGTPWSEADLTIRETARPIAEGWGGWNDPDANEISVGEDFDRALWTHELAHNWIDDEQFSEDWLLEGMTETITAHLADELDIDEPPEPDATTRPLVEWNDILAEADRALVDDPDAWYDTTNELYAGAQHVVGTVADEIGEDAFREIVRMTLQDKSAWGDLGTAVPDSAADWREFLDLAERVGGSGTARGLILQRVRPGSESLLARRDEAIEAWDTMADDPWGVPTSVAAAMHVWRFNDAEARIADALAARADIEALATRADEMGLAVPDLQEAWRTTSMQAVTEQVAAVDGALDDVDDLRARVEEMGLPDPDLDVNPATDDPDDIRQRVSTVDAAIDRIMDAEAALDAASADPIASAGLAGADHESLRARARTALAAGDVQGVTIATAQLEDVVDGAIGEGRLRVGGAVTVVVVVLLLLAIVVWRRRSRSTT